MNDHQRRRVNRFLMAAGWILVLFAPILVSTYEHSTGSKDPLLLVEVELFGIACLCSRT
jgi:hypothetical protein